MAQNFHARSADRDAKTDQVRLELVALAIKAAVKSVQSERDALRGRVNAARDLASFAAGTDYDEYLTRDSKDQARIREYEKQMAAGDRRIEELDRQMAGLTAVREVFGRYFPEPSR